LSSRKFFLNRL